MEHIFINEQTGERAYAQRSGPWIGLWDPFTDGEVFWEGTGWMLRVWRPGYKDEESYLSEEPFPTEEEAQSYIDYCRGIGRHLQNIMRAGG